MYMYKKIKASTYGFQSAPPVTFTSGVLSEHRTIFVKLISAEFTVIIYAELKLLRFKGCLFQHSFTKGYVFSFLSTTYCVFITTQDFLE